MKQPKIDQTKCLGCGTCTVICPNTFALSGATAIISNPSGNSETEINAAIAGCPVQSIAWIEE